MAAVNNPSLILRLTQSVCPTCSVPLTARIIREEEGVFMEKHCSLHGSFRLCLSRTPALYSDLDGFYCALMNTPQPNFDYEIWPTLRCNMNCAICFFGCPREEFPGIVEPTIAAIEQFVSQDKHSFYCLSGAEATSRDDLPDIIKVIKKYRKAVTLNTNGLRLQEESYLLKLKSAGLDRVVLQFDGFDPCISTIMRGEDIIVQKQAVLALLQKHHISTALSVTIARHVNEHTVKELIQYALEHPFINGIGFLSIAFDGGARHWSPGSYIMPDEVIDLVCLATDHKVRKESVHIFQKLHYAVKAFFRQRACLYNQLYILVREGDSFVPIDAFVNLLKADRWLDRYRQSFAKGQWLAPVYLGLALLSLACHRRFPVLLKDLLVSGLSYFSRTSRYLRTSRLLAVSFTTGCDPYKLDRTILQNCQNEIVAADQTPHVLRPIGREGAFFIDAEKRHAGQHLPPESHKAQERGRP